MIREKVDDISGVILAGGENKRFGGIIKSNIEIGGFTIISRINKTISEIFNEIIVVTNTPDRFKNLTGCKMTTDQYSRVGPLGGIHAAMKASYGKAVFIFAGDMPFVDKEIIMRQIDCFFSHDCEALIPRINSLEEPLHAVYSVSLLGKLEEYLEGGEKYAVRDFLVNKNVHFMDIEASPQTEKAFTNINEPSGIEPAEKYL